MALYFDNVDVTINNINLMADSASIESQNNVIPLQSLGKRGVFNQAPDGPIRSSFNISYYIQTSKEPNYTIVNNLRTAHNNFNYAPDNIGIGGITGACYLESYNIKINPNEIAKATVSYVSYSSLSGNLLTRNYAGGGSSGVSGISGGSGYSGTTTTDFDVSGLAHGWTTFVTSTTSYDDIPTHSLEYNCRVNWEPVYIVGKKEPNQVQLMGGQESIKLVRDTYKKIQFSGEELKNYLNITEDDYDIDMNEINYLCTSVANTPLTISISGAKVKNVSVNAVLDDIVRVETVAEKFF